MNLVHILLINIAVQLFSIWWRLSTLSDIREHLDMLREQIEDVQKKLFDMLGKNYEHVQWLELINKNINKGPSP
jgi:hypothetical protein